MITIATIVFSTILLLLILETTTITKFKFLAYAYCELWYAGQNDHEIIKLPIFFVLMSTIQ